MQDVLKLMLSSGLNVECASLGELTLAQRAGFPPEVRLCVMVHVFAAILAREFPRSMSCRCCAEDNL
jgi:diaminopimelate decarboxylase